MLTLSRSPATLREVCPNSAQLYSSRVVCGASAALTCDAARGVQLPEHHDEAQQVAEVAGDAEEVQEGPHREVCRGAHVDNFVVQLTNLASVLQPSKENSFVTTASRRVETVHRVGPRTASCTPPCCCSE